MDRLRRYFQQYRTGQGRCSLHPDLAATARPRQPAHLPTLRARAPGQAGHPIPGPHYDVHPNGPPPLSGPRGAKRPSVFSGPTGKRRGSPSGGRTGRTLLSPPSQRAREVLESLKDALASAAEAREVLGEASAPDSPPPLVIASSPEWAGEQEGVEDLSTGRGSGCGTRGSAPPHDQSEREDGTPLSENY